ncbi:hypothetical protein SDC9_08040 [bioreactor metagenome]|uniref:Uncharacterized protein n=1 Tax=bioreactor metagenome TaxID=1076179 RepID=A0A644T6D1_9ZZZZ|nr:hypothetical protein [Candidatus Elulimicrobiales bacterium]
MKRRFFVVIHALSLEEYGPLALPHVRESARIAFEEGAHGVFLIPDYVKGFAKAKLSDLSIYYDFLNEEYQSKDFLVGINFLLRRSELDGQLENLVSEINPRMLQTDYLSATVTKHYFPFTQIFGSFAFKGSKQETATGEELKVLSKLAEKYCDVPTTSGSATGVAAPIEKVKEIRSYLNSETRLGIASGADIQNVRPLIDAGATDFLVATSLIKEVKDKRDILDPELVKKMVRAVRSYG